MRFLFFLFRISDSVSFIVLGFVQSSLFVYYCYLFCFMVERFNQVMNQSSDGSDREKYVPDKTFMASHSFGRYSTKRVATTKEFQIRFTCLNQVGRILKASV